MAKWEPLSQSLHNLVDITLIMFSTWLNFGKIWPNFFSDFGRKILNPFSPVEHFICHIFGMVGPIDVKQKGNESTGYFPDQRTLTFDLFKVKLYLLNGRPDCNGTKGTGVDRMPWCERLRMWVNRMLCWLGYLWPLPLTLNFQGQIASWEWEGRLSWNKRDGSQ